MKMRRVGFGATALALAILASGCSTPETADGGDGGWNDSGPDCYPSDAGYCDVCHPMTACGEYPPGPYGMMTGQTMPPCLMGTGDWNPTGLWLFDGGNPQFASDVPLFQDLYCSSQQMGQTFGLVQVVITQNAYGRMQATNMAQCINGPQEHWLASGGQVMQIIEQSDNGLAPGESDLVTWAEMYNTNYSLGADDGEVLLTQTDMDATHGFPVTFIVNLKTMQILKALSYGADWGQIQEDFTNVLDSGIVY
jgi:hypothetical protein